MGPRQQKTNFTNKHIIPSTSKEDHEMLWEFKMGDMTQSEDRWKGFTEEVMLTLISLEWLGTIVGKRKWGKMFHLQTTEHVKKGPGRKHAPLKSREQASMAGVHKGKRVQNEVGSIGRKVPAHAGPSRKAMES